MNWVAGSTQSWTTEKQAGSGLCRVGPEPVFFAHDPFEQDPADQVLEGVEWRRAAISFRLNSTNSV